MFSNSFNSGERKYLGGKRTGWVLTDKIWVEKEKVWVAGENIGVVRDEVVLPGHRTSGPPYRGG